MAEIWDLLGKERKSSLPRGTRINSIPRWIQESVPRKYEIGEHKFVRIYGRPRTNVSTSGRVLPALGPPSTSESISQVLHPPGKGTLPPLETFLGTRAPFIISFFPSFFFSKFHPSLFRVLSTTRSTKWCNNNRICAHSHVRRFVFRTRASSCPIFVKPSKDYRFNNLSLSFYFAVLGESRDNKFPLPRVEKFNRLPKIYNARKAELRLGRLMRNDRELIASPPGRMTPCLPSGFCIQVKIRLVFCYRPFPTFESLLRKSWLRLTWLVFFIFFLSFL